MANKKTSNSLKKKWITPKLKKLDFKQTLGGPTNGESEYGFWDGSVFD